MSWERRGTGRYYTKSVRLGGKVRRVYLGAGPLAEYVACQDAAAAAVRAAERAALAEERAAAAAARAAAGGLGQAARELMHAALAAAGFRRVNRAWRRCAMARPTGKQTDQQPGRAARARAALEANGPDAAPTTDELREFLSGGPRVAPDPTDLVGRAEAGWVALVAGADDGRRRDLARRLAEFKAGLGAAASPLEQVLVAQIGTVWLESYYFSIRTTGAGGEGVPPAHLRFLVGAADAAHRRLAFLVRQLATVRGLLGTTARARTDVV